jgi:drug/metabolite transporter (DMT)-like permease
MPPMMANGMRFLAGALVLALGFMAFKGPSALRVTRSQLAYTALMGVTLLGVGIGTLSLAERYVPSGIAALLVSVMPLWIVLLRMRAGDRPSRLTWIGVAVGLIGVALMVLPGGTEARTGGDHDVVLWSIAILVSSACWAFFSWKSTSFDLPSSALVTTIYELAVAGFFLLGVGTLRSERIDFSMFTAPSWWGWTWLVIASIIGYTSYSWLIANAPMSLVSTYAYVNPAVAVLLGWLLLAEPITRDVILGLTVVLGGVVLVISGERRQTG